MCCMAGVHYAQYINANSLSLLLLLQPPKLQEPKEKKKRKICLKAVIDQPLMWSWDTKIRWNHFFAFQNVFVWKFKCVPSQTRVLPGAGFEGSHSGFGCVPRAAEDGVGCWHAGSRVRKQQCADTGHRTFTEISIKRKITTLYLD